jgi:hypothetical protein
MDKKTLKNIGLALYWAEGEKSKRKRKGKDDGSRRHIEFANRDPQMISIFLDFLKNILHISEEKIKLKVQIAQNRVIIAKKYWSEITGLPLSQFNKSKIRNRKTRTADMGCLYIRVNSAKLKRTLDIMLEEIKP